MNFNEDVSGIRSEVANLERKFRDLELLMMKLKMFNETVIRLPSGKPGFDAVYHIWGQQHGNVPAKGGHVGAFIVSRSDKEDEDGLNIGGGTVFDAKNSSCDVEGLQNQHPGDGDYITLEITLDDDKYVTSASLAVGGGAGDGLIAGGGKINIAQIKLDTESSEYVVKEIFQIQHGDVRLPLFEADKEGSILYWKGTAWQLLEPAGELSALTSEGEELEWTGTTECDDDDSSGSESESSTY